MCIAPALNLVALTTPLDMEQAIFCCERHDRLLRDRRAQQLAWMRYQPIAPIS